MFNDDVDLDAAFICPIDWSIVSSALVSRTLVLSYIKKHVNFGMITFTMIASLITNTTLIIINRCWS